MNDDARILLSVLANLPDGFVSSKLSNIDSRFDEAARTLRKVGLAYDEGARIQVLAPIREYVREHHVVPGDVLDAAISYYVGIAEAYGPKVEEAILEVGPEIANLEQTLLSGLARPEAAKVINAVIAMTDFYRFSGLETTDVIEKTRDIAYKSADFETHARCTLSLGEIALDRSEHEDAEKCYQEAFSYYQGNEMSDCLKAATCKRGLADIALYRDEISTAQGLYEEARNTFQNLGYIRGELHAAAR